MDYHKKYFQTKKFAEPDFYTIYFLIKNGKINEISH